MGDHRAGIFHAVGSCPLWRVRIYGVAIAQIVGEVQHGVSIAHQAAVIFIEDEKS